VQAFNDAFGVKLSRCEHQSETYRARTGSISIPSDLDGIIEGVFGLDNRPQAKPHFRMRKARPRAVAVSYTPLQVAQAYNFPSGADGSGQCIGIVELGGGYTVEGLNSFFRSLGISMPKVTAISVDGGKNTPTGDPNGPDGKVELDIEVAGAIAPGAQIAVYFAPNTDQGFIDAITTAVHDKTCGRRSFPPVGAGRKIPGRRRRATRSIRPARMQLLSARRFSPPLATMALPTAPRTASPLLIFQPRVRM
jgi:kumamolisin